MKCSSEQELSGLNFPQTDTFLWCLLFKPCFSNSRSWEVTVAQERTLPQWQASQGVGFPSKAHVQQSHHIGMCRILNVFSCFSPLITRRKGLHELIIMKLFFLKGIYSKGLSLPMEHGNERWRTDFQVQDSDSSGLSQSLSCCLSFVFQ